MIDTLPLLTQHPQRARLHNEVHARAPEVIGEPLAIAHMVMLLDATDREASRQASRRHLAALLARRQQPAPDEDATHIKVDVGDFHLRWALHTEFVTWTVAVPLPFMPDDPQTEPPTALSAVPQDWLASLPGQCLCALHLWVLAGHEEAFVLPCWLHAAALVASRIGGGTAVGEVYTDFAMHADGFSRMLLRAGSLPPRQLGRMVQCLLELESYRMAALLGLPAAREVGVALACAEHELADLARAIRSAGHDEEAVLLDRLTHLAGQVESQYAATHARFSASSAYFELVDRRIQEMAETRVAGMQTIGEFMERRLRPARSTCAWAARRQDALSMRVARMSSLLRTRVEIAQQHSSAALLASMNRRAALQLRLQSTVEGLSAVAMTSYIVGLVHYLAKGAQALGWPFSPDATAASALPLVGAGVWWALRRLHQRMFNVGHRGAL